MTVNDSGLVGIRSLPWSSKSFYSAYLQAHSLICKSASLSHEKTEYVVRSEHVIYLRAQDTAQRYDYSVEFTGVGNPPAGMEDVGFCTQIGVFVRKYPQTREPVPCEKPTEAAYKTVSILFFI